MTHLNLHHSLPATLNDRIAELFSAATLILSGVLGLVALATI